MAPPVSESEDQEQVCGGQEKTANLDPGVASTDSSSLTTLTPKPRKNRVAFHIVIASLCICGFASALDTIILASTLPAIAASLRATTVAAYWCSSAFLFAQSVVQLVYASFAQAFNRRTCMLVALAIFFGASILCATAQNVQWLIAARTLQGVGTGGINTLIQLILTDIAPIAERPKYTGIITLFAAIGLVSGSLCGAVIVQNTTWRVIFWINMPLCILPFIGFACCLRLPETGGMKKPRVVEVVKRMDWGGLTLVTASLGAILFALNSGNTVYPWSSPKIIASLACGCAGLVLFALYEEFVAKSTAILPRRLFSNTTATVGYVVTIIHAMLVWSVTYYFFLYLSMCFPHSYLGASVIMLAISVFFPVAAGATGFIVGRTSRYKLLNVAAFLLIVGATGGFISLSEKSSTAQQVGFLIICGIGGGIAFVNKVFMVQAAVAESDVLMATALVATATSIGECFGVAVASSVFQNTWKSQLERHLAAGLLHPVITSQDAERSATFIGTLQAPSGDIYRHIASTSFQRVWIVMNACAGVALILVVLARDARPK